MTLFILAAWGGLLALWLAAKAVKLYRRELSTVFACPKKHWRRRA